ncbi:hypothetical protein BH93_27465 (plasmid) [Rhodococcoides fascians A25f]|uniref:hypothetical protein n=1 Tax=Rhodococcoides fascians TaxID=1828 RepID=UPI000564BD42|nr:hypothetical protein [Rhodococcus fascians]QII09311.1 hypothetical protein BH93_27465 [Rhodococcus fascians A25f]
MTLALSSAAAHASASLLAAIPTGDEPRTPPPEATAQLEQVGRYFFWFVTGALSIAGVLAGIYLAVAYSRHGQLGEGEKRVVAVAIAAVVVGSSGAWAPLLL